MYRYTHSCKQIKTGGYYAGGFCLLPLIYVFFTNDQASMFSRRKKHYGKRLYYEKFQSFLIYLGIKIYIVRTNIGEKIAESYLYVEHTWQKRNNVIGRKYLPYFHYVVSFHVRFVLLNLKRSILNYSDYLCMFV